MILGKIYSNQGNKWRKRIQHQITLLIPLSPVFIIAAVTPSPAAASPLLIKPERKHCCLLPSPLSEEEVRIYAGLKWPFQVPMSGSAGHGTYLIFPRQSLGGYQNNPSLVSGFCQPFHWSFKKFKKLAFFTILHSCSS